MLSESVAVTAAVIERAGRYLLGQRQSGKRHGGLWEFPGGKLLPGESIEGALVRELEEELGLAVEAVGRVLGRVRDPGSPFEVAFVQVTATGVPRAIEHAEGAWFDAEAVARLALAPADRQFVLAWLKGV